MLKTIVCLTTLLIMSAHVAGQDEEAKEQSPDHTKASPASRTAGQPTDKAGMKPASTVQTGRFLGRIWQHPQMKGGITSKLDVFDSDGSYLDTVWLAMGQPYQASQWLELTGSYKRTYIPAERAEVTSRRLDPVDPENPGHQDVEGGYLCTFEIESRKPVQPTEKQMEWEAERILGSIVKALGNAWMGITVRVFDKPGKDDPSAGPSYVVSAAPSRSEKAVPNANTKLALYLLPLGQAYTAAPKVVPMGQSTQYELHMPSEAWARLRACGSVDAWSVMDRVRDALDARWVATETLWLRAWTSGRWPDRNQPVVLVDMLAMSEPKNPEKRKWHHVVKLEDGTLCQGPNEKPDDMPGYGVLRPGYLTRTGIDIRHWKVPDRNNPGRQVNLIDAPWVKFVRVGVSFDDQTEHATDAEGGKNIFFSHPIPVWPVGADPSKPEVSKEMVAAARPVVDTLMALGYGVDQQADDAPPHLSGKVRSMRILVVRRNLKAARGGYDNTKDVHFHFWLTPKDCNGKPLEANLEKGATPAELLMESDDALLFVHNGQRPAMEDWKLILDALKKTGFRSTQGQTSGTPGER